MRVALENFARASKLVAGARQIREYVDALFADARPDSGSEYTFDIPTGSFAAGSDPSIEIIFEEEPTPVERPQRAITEHAIRKRSCASRSR